MGKTAFEVLDEKLPEIQNRIMWFVGHAVRADGSVTKYIRVGDKLVELKTTPAGHKICYDYEVKSWPWLFEPMCAGKKTHDMRDKRDRSYKIGDRMLLREFDPRTGQYTGREAAARITYITDNVTPCAMSSGALANDFCILSVQVMDLEDNDRNA